jgi:hypothetical protein
MITFTAGATEPIFAGVWTTIKMVITGFSTFPLPHPSLVWLASFFTAAVEAAIGLSIGPVIPRPLEVTGLLMGIIGFEKMTPCSVSFRHYLPLFVPHAFFLLGRWASEISIRTHGWRSLNWAASLFAFTACGSGGCASTSHRQHLEAALKGNS